MKRAIPLLLLLLLFVFTGCPDAPLPEPPDLACRAKAVAFAACKRGEEIFAREFTPSTGLGAQHNGTSCLGCHFNPIPGGEGTFAERVYFTATRFDGTKERAFPPSQPFHVPPPLWWLGDMETITDQEIAAGCGIDDELGIHGLPSAKGTKIGRVGRHGEALTVHAFTASAFERELGGCAPFDASEHSTCVAGDATIVTADDVDDVTAYVLGLAAPAPLPMSPQDRASGEALFGQVGCAVCHSPARSFRSDLCTHDMGSANADDQEWGHRWRTAPLSGLRLLTSFFHDGRAATVAGAIESHDGGEGIGTVKRYRALSSENRSELVRFVEGL